MMRFYHKSTEIGKKCRELEFSYFASGLITTILPFLIKLSIQLLCGLSILLKPMPIFVNESTL